MQNTAQHSVEDILESIKRVIARDNNDSAQAQRRHRETAGMVVHAKADPAEFADDDDVLDDDDAEVLDLAEEIADETDRGDAVDLEVAAEVAEPEAASDTQTQVRHSLDALAALSGAGQSGAATEAESPLDRMVRETLRPLLADWLDANLPPIVERLVKIEIERISGKPR